MPASSRSFRLICSGGLAVGLSLALGASAGAQGGGAATCPNESQAPILGTAAADTLNGTPNPDRIVAGDPPPFAQRPSTGCTPADMFARPNEP